MLELNLNLGAVNAPRPEKVISDFPYSLDLVQVKGISMFKVGTEMPTEFTKFDKGEQNMTEGYIIVNGEHKLCQFSVTKWSVKTASFKNLAKGFIGKSKAENDEEVKCVLVPVTLNQDGSIARVTLRGKVKKGESPRTAVVCRCQIGEYDVALWIKDKATSTASTSQKVNTEDANSVDELDL